MCEGGYLAPSNLFEQQKGKAFTLFSNESIRNFVFTFTGSGIVWWNLK